MKQIQKTEAMLAQIRKISGDVDASALPVFESISANTLPLSKRGSIYDKAQMTESLLGSMAAHINAQGLPLHTLHNQDVLPIGKTFAASVVANDAGAPELRTLFYVSPAHADLAAQLDDGSIDEVSVGFLPANAMCSECGHDYLGADSTVEQWMDRVCANGHALGEDGVHLNVAAFDKFSELSLVSKGAVQGAKVVSGDRARLTADATHRLAASGLSVSSIALYATATPTPKKSQEFNMDLTALVKELTDAKVALALSDAKVAAHELELTELRATVAAYVAPAVTDAEVKLTAATAELEASTAFLREQATKALTATAGDVSSVATMAVADLTKVISEAQAKLSTLFPAGGRSLNAASEDVASEEKPLGADRHAFRANR